MGAAHPDRPAFAFRVGVVGNRWDKLGLGEPRRTRTAAESGPEWLERARLLDEQLGASVGAVLAAIGEQLRGIAATPENGYGPTPARLALVSGLAEGADRIAAQAGLAHGYQLWAILPYDADAYAADFDERWTAPGWSRPGALGEYRELLSRAAGSTLVMDGEPGRYDAYEALGRSVVAHSDLLIAIWDGDESRGPGGTANSLLDARRDEIPVIRFDPAAPGEPWLEDLRHPGEGRRDGLSRLARRLDDLVRPPELAGLLKAESGRAAFFGESAIAGRFGKSYRAMRAYLLGIHHPVAAALLPTAFVWLGLIPTTFSRTQPVDYEAACRDDWRERLRLPLAKAPGLADRVIGELAPLHGWLDHLASYYANRYRSAFTAIFSLAWIASVAAVVGLVAHVRHWPPVVVKAIGGLELFAIGAIFVMTLWGTRQRFHRKWVEYRHLAEQIRHLTFLWPLGVTTGFARVPVSPSTDDPRVGWSGWLYRATVRRLGLATTRVDDDYLAACRSLLRGSEIPAQRDYHDRSAAAFRHLHHVVHLRTEWLFFAALPLVIAHILGAPEWLAERLGGSTGAVAANGLLIGAALTTLSVFLPARAAALHGWAGQADFHGSALRSAAIELRLEEVERSIDTLASSTSATLGEAALAASRAMEGELGAWRATSLSKPLVRA